MLILAIIVIGIAAGWVAQLVLERGGRETDWTLAFVTGVIGSFVGGLLFSLIAGDGLELRMSGLIGSVVGAIVVLAIVRAVRGGRSTAR
ncbi:MAG TPA: GlsB/YeaQ/YmgE family stress response membrane protein [Actinomycetota bacterium]|nr:GlsB/YeaQ/YmgE family stress response membrane protein [Actinomycetota bacterium]